jgi:hypothetical protein
MVLSLTQGDRQHNSTWQSSETFSESTATAQRSLDANVDVSFLGMGTATAGPVHNQYKLEATTTASGREGDAVEGMEKVIMATATGRADVFIALPTQGRLPLQLIEQSNPGATGDIVMVSATGTWVFQTDGDFMFLKFMNGTWNYLAGAGATQSAAT